MKRLGLIFIMVMFGTLTFAESVLSNWGDWDSIDDYTSYRVRCVRLNSSVGKYVWEVEVRNESNKTLSISIAVTDGNQPSSGEFGRNTIESGDSYVFPLMFAKSGPDTGISIWWKNIQYK